MEAIVTFVTTANSIVWGPAMLVLILGTGLYLSIGLKGITLKNIPYAFQQLWKGRHHKDSKIGEITPFSALMTSLSATIGTGNIAGVAVAIAIGGPGALFWMWLTALVGMATKYAEAVLAVHYREINDKGEHVGGPMYYIKNGLGAKWTWLAFAFSFFGAIAAFGIGNTVQANSVADGLNSSFGAPQWLTGITIMALVAAVILGGIKRIATFSSWLVPFMGITYLLAGMLIILINIGQLPGVIMIIIKSAFSGHAAAGGFAGSTMIIAMQWGIARGVFSNEAGLGSASIAHAHAETKDPINQGTIAMLGTFIDTIIICSITGFVIVLSGTWLSGETGVPLTSTAFESGLPGIGHYLVSISLAIFAFTTMIGWSVYGERCVTYLLGTKAIIPFRILWILAIPVGALSNLKFIWLLADTFNALMAIPNLIALILLSPVVFKLTQQSFNIRQTKPSPIIKNNQDSNPDSNQNRTDS